MAPNPFRDILLDTEAVVLDGGLATELEANGKNLSDHLWSARMLDEDPEAIKHVHLSYYRAGADCATTASYQASYEGFAKAGYDQAHAEALMRRSVTLADQARQLFWDQHTGTYEARADDGGETSSTWEAKRHKPLVAFSCGPYGATLADGSEYDGSYATRVSEEQLMAFHRDRILAISGMSEVDLLAFETIPCLKEARAISRLLRTEGFGIPAWISFSCRNSKELSRPGEQFAPDALCVAAEAPAVVATGLNCTSPLHVLNLLQAARPALREDCLLLAYPNAGEEWCAGSQAGTERGWKPGSGCPVAEFAAAAKEWHQAGAEVLGGFLKYADGVGVAFDDIGVVRWQLDKNPPPKDVVYQKCISQAQ